MKQKFLSFVSIAFLGMSALPMMGASGCTYRYVSADGTVREESDGQVRINRGRFCVRARDGGRYITGRAWLKMRYRYGSERRNIERGLALEGRAGDCVSVTFGRPVAIEDVEVVTASLE